MDICVSQIAPSPNSDTLLAKINELNDHIKKWATANGITTINPDLSFTLGTGEIHEAYFDTHGKHQGSLLSRPGVVRLLKAIATQYSSFNDCLNWDQIKKNSNLESSQNQLRADNPRTKPATSSPPPTRDTDHGGWRQVNRRRPLNLTRGHPTDARTNPPSTDDIPTHRRQEIEPRRPHLTNTNTQVARSHPPSSPPASQHTYRSRWEALDERRTPRHGLSPPRGREGYSERRQRDQDTPSPHTSHSSGSRLHRHHSPDTNTTHYNRQNPHPYHRYPHSHNDITHNEYPFHPRQSKPRRGCYNCGEFNHHQSNCRYDHQIRCGNCYNLGHKYKSCNYYGA